MADRKTYLRDYSRLWIAARRRQFFADKTCAACGSTYRLELDHIDPSLKISHNIWSWSEVRRNDEIKKCQILCNSCHKAKSAAYARKLLTDRPKPTLRKLNDDQITAIRLRLNSGESERTLSFDYHVGKTTIHSIKTGQYYKFGSGGQI